MSSLENSFSVRLKSLFYIIISPLQLTFIHLHFECGNRNTKTCFLTERGIIWTTTIWVFPKCFHWIQRIQWQNICHYCKGAQNCHPATSCVRDQDATTVSARHMWETGSLNWSHFMLQRFIRFPEIVEFVEFFSHLRKTPPCL